MIFEWFWERKNRGPVGTVDTERPERATGHPVWLLFRGLVGAALIAGGVVLALGAGRPMAWLGLFAFYLFVSYFIRPEPDRTNLGWAGFIDNPFRWSDDQNRMLLWLKVMLLPGRFAVAAVRDLREIVPRRDPGEPKRLREKGVIWQRKD